jgi:predicted transcriptional regulator
MLDDDFLLNFIKEKCKELGISGYDIGKNTSISEQSAYKILDGTTKKPRRKNLLVILEYLESKVVGTKIKEFDQLNEPAEVYQTHDDLQKAMLKLQNEHIQLMKERDRLLKILEKNKLKS